MPMNALATQLALIGGVLAALLVGPGIALVFLRRRKGRRDARRRSPIGFELLRGPGHSLREELDDTMNDATWDIVALSVLPLVLLAAFLVQARAGLIGNGSPEIIYAAAAIGVVAWRTRKLLKTGAKLDRLRAGFDAELAVGQELDQLMRLGAAVYHDFPADGFNIDHVVVAPQGVFAVETQGYTKAADSSGRAAATVTFDGHVLKFPGWTTSEPLEQAERQARWLSRWATSAIGGTVVVTPVLALPGWFVERTGRSAVRVYSGRALGSLLKVPSPQPLSDVDLQRIAHQVEQRCRTVAPTWGGADASRT